MMQAALVDLADRKLRDAKQRAQQLLAQWQATIQQIEAEEKHVGCALLHADMEVNIPVDLAKRLPEANYLEVVVMRGRATQGFSDAVTHATSVLKTEIQRSETVNKEAEAGIVAVQTNHNESLRQAESRCKSKEGSKAMASVVIAFAIIGAVASEIGLYGLANSLSMTSQHSSTLQIVTVLCVLFGWLVGLLVVLVIVKVFERLSANSAFSRTRKTLSHEFNGRLFEFNATITEGANRLKAAKAALARLPCENG